MTITRKTFILTLSVIVSFLITACDLIQSPVIVNETNSSITVSLSFYEGFPDQLNIALLGQNAYVQRLKGYRLSRLIAQVDGKTFEWTPNELANLRGFRQSEFEVWFISTNGLRLGGKPELRAFYTHKARN